MIASSCPEHWQWTPVGEVARAQGVSRRSPTKKKNNSRRPRWLHLSPIALVDAEASDPVLVRALLLVISNLSNTSQGPESLHPTRCSGTSFRRVVMLVRVAAAPPHERLRRACVYRRNCRAGMPGKPGARSLGADPRLARRCGDQAEPYTLVAEDGTSCSCSIAWGF